MSQSRLDDLPGFRRRFLVTPGSRAVVSELEDDYHCMRVVLHHDGSIVTKVEPVIFRAPWTTCPGATAQLERSFTGEALDRFVYRSEKSSNCTHLYDLAMLAAAHARDATPLVYDVLVSDPIGGRKEAELRRNGTPLMRWTLEAYTVVEPPEIAGTTLLKLGPWIETLDAGGQEAARVLRWASLVAGGRQIPLAQQSDASTMPPNCYTFQPERAMVAERVGIIRDFSEGDAVPLEGRTSAAVD
jgi:hypothetical protein